MKTYPPRVPTQNPRLISNRQLQEAVDEHNIDIGDEMDLDEEVVLVDDTDDTAEEDYREIEVFDLTDDSLSSPPPEIIESPPQIIVSAPEVIEIPEETIEQTPAPDLVDEYFDGLAYRLGQIESSPNGAAKATVEFAGKMKTQYEQTKGKQIPKPLPATPVTVEPLELSAAAASPCVRRREALRRSKSLFGDRATAPVEEGSSRVGNRERISWSEGPIRFASIRMEIPARSQVVESLDEL